LRSKNDVQILNRSFEAAKCLQCLQCINECMGSEFRSIVQPRNYNLRKLSGIISNAKRRMELYVRHNSFNKGIILNCIVFWNSMSKGLTFWLYFTNFSQIIRHLATCSVNWYIEGKYLSVEATISISGEIATWKYQLQKFDYFEHQDFVGILSLVYICIMPAVCLCYNWLQLLIHTFFCELFGWISNNNNPLTYVNQASLHWIVKLELQFFELPHPPNIM
jgi:hypothetical protein